MASSSYILNRKGSYYFRIAVPTHLRGTLGTAELTRSLQTKYLPEAKERSTILLTSVRELFKVVTAMPRLTPDEIKLLSRTYFHEVVFPRFTSWVDAIQSQDRFKALPSVPFEEREGPSIEEMVGKLIHPKGYKEHEFLQAMGNELIKKLKVNLIWLVWIYSLIKGIRISLWECLGALGLACRPHHPLPPPSTH